MTPRQTATGWAAAGLLMVPMAGHAHPHDFPLVVERADTTVDAAVADSLQPDLPSEGALVPTSDAAAGPAVDARTEAVAVPATAPDDTPLNENGSVAVISLGVPAAEAPLPLSGGASSAGFASTGRALTLYASDKVLRVEYERDSDLFNQEDARLSAGYLLSEERDSILTGTYMLETFPGLIPNVDLAFGARAYVALLGRENRDIFGAGIGARGQYNLPVEAFPLSLGVSVYYTPDILVFGQADRIFDLSADVGFELRENLSAFVGVRYLSFDTTPGGTDDVEDDVHIGFTWQLAAPAQTAVTAPTQTAPPVRFR